MKLNEGQLYAAINEFVEQVILPLGASMNLSEQFMFGLKIGIARRKMQDIVKTYVNSDAAKTLGLIDENGYIDVDTIYQSACDSMAQVGRFEVSGITFKEADLQRLYSIMQRYSN